MVARQGGAISEIVGHPLRLRILQEMAGRERTTAQLREALPDIPQATLYRHVAVLVKAEVLAVSSQRRVRGAVERTYVLGERMARVDRADLDALSDDQIAAAFLAFVQELARGFENALDLGKQARDHLGFSTTALYVDDADLTRLQQQLRELVSPYIEPVSDKQRVLLSTVLFPAR